MLSVLLVEGAEEFALVRDFAIIMAVAGAVVVLFRKLNQPPILGYLLAGLIIGPFTLPTPLISNTEIIRLLADLGLVLLLFALGLEFGWRRIRQVGLGVLIIGSLEILTMISLGYWVGRMLGWTAQESIFLGAALSISSSAVLVKVLRDTGQLTTIRGRLIVGILVVEDFAAVILLTLLSGIASTGTAEIQDVGFLVMKLSIFAIASLALGAVFVPRIIRLVAGFGSRETLLLASLALCFILALLGQSLGISAAAGAFLIGAVIGDTEEADHIVETIEPIRDMFAALFFVSIGMLIDIRLIADHIVPALIISAVFMVGKMVANTAGTFIAGQGGRVPIQVGMGMPQIGEFSLAMMKIGAEQEAIRAFLYQVIVGVTAITSLVYPYVAKSAEGVANLLEKRSPRWLRRSYNFLSVALQSFRNSLAFDTEFAHRIRRASVPIAISFLIIVVLIGVGTFATRFAEQIAAPMGISEVLVGNMVGLATLLLCIPSAIALWKGLQNLSNEATSHMVLNRRFLRVVSQETLRNIIRDSILVLLVFVIGFWSLPLVLELLSLGALATPLPLIILAGLAMVAVRILVRMQQQLVIAFSDTFMGGTGQTTTQSEASPQPESVGSTSGDHAGVLENEADEFRLESPAATHPASGTESPQGAISLGDAEMLALSIASADRSPYPRWLNRRELVWDISDSTEINDNFRISLNYRERRASEEDVGEEEIYLDKEGKLRMRQITSWPSQAAPGNKRLIIFSAFLGLVILGTAAGVLSFPQWGPELFNLGG